MRHRMFLTLAVGFAVVGAGAVGAFAGGGNNTGDSGTTTVQCLTDDGVQGPSSEPIEGAEYSSITVSPTTLWPPNNKMQTIGLTMNFSDDEPDSATLTVLSISSNQGSSADWSGVGNSASGNADGSNISTSVQVRAQRDGNDLAGRTYNITLQCADGGTAPGPQNTVTVQVKVPHDQGK